MTPIEAAEAIIAMSSGQAQHTNGSGGHKMTAYRFPTTADADRCKAILDALMPGSTGAVYGMAQLLLQTYEPPETPFGDWTDELNAILGLELPEQAHRAVTLFGTLERAVKEDAPKARDAMDALLTQVFKLPADSWKG